MARAAHKVIIGVVGHVSGSEDVVKVDARAVFTCQASSVVVKRVLSCGCAVGARRPKRPEVSRTWRNVVADPAPDRGLQAALVCSTSLSTGFPWHRVSSLHCPLAPVSAPECFLRDPARTPPTPEPRWLAGPFGWLLLVPKSSWSSLHRASIFRGTTAFGSGGLSEPTFFIVLPTTSRGTKLMNSFQPRCALERSSQVTATTSSC